MEFYNWIEKIAKDDTPAGDLARNILRDKRFPKKAKDWKTVSDYLPNDEKIQNIAETAFENYLNDIENR